MLDNNYVRVIGKFIATVPSLLYIPPDWSAQCRRSLQRYMLALVTEINYRGVFFEWEKACSYTTHTV